MQSTTIHKETYTHYSTRSGNTQVYIYRRREKTAFSRFMENLLADNCYFLKQKLLGLLALGTGVAELTLGYMGMIDEGGAFIFMLPLGLYTLFTKKKFTTFN